MPHAISMEVGFQAFILCGPGSSLSTFTANPDTNPKALIPIGNRPMVWYPIDFCYRMGVTRYLYWEGCKVQVLEENSSKPQVVIVQQDIWLWAQQPRGLLVADSNPGLILHRYMKFADSPQDITLITPPASASALEAALKTNPHLTGLPLPKPDLLAPKDLDLTTGTAEIFRLPEVKSVVQGDFIVLPCDLVCEIGGESLLETWMIKEAGLGGATGGKHEFSGPKMAMGGEKGGRRGGLGVWYETKGDTIIKGEQTDFIATSPLEASPVKPPRSSLLPHAAKLVYSVPTDTLKDITEDKKSLPLRFSLIREHSRIRMLSSHRDAHIYIFPAWVVDMINLNEHMDSIGEDVIGWWAKAGWQEGLGDKLRLREVFEKPAQANLEENMLDNAPESDVTDFSSLSTTWTTKLDGGLPSSEDESKSSPGLKSKLVIPPILSYIHPAKPTAKGPPLMIRRVDTAPLLLSISLQLAKIESVEEVGREAASPLAHPKKVAETARIASRTTVTRSDCLLAENVTVEEKCSIKECVIGANCEIMEGARLTRCVLMDNVVVRKGCKLTGCILGRRSDIGEDSILQDCEVQENMSIESKTETKNEKIMSSEGMEATEQEIRDFDDENPDEISSESE